MQYLLLIYEDESIYGPDKNGPLMQVVGPQHMDFAKSLGPAWVAGAGLKATSAATTVRNEGAAGRTLHDGPFAESKEQLGGFYMIDVADLDAAIAIARKMPLAEGGSVEIRPVIHRG
jgi:hypothetical protein